MLNKLGPIHSDRRKRKMDAIYARNAAQERVARDVKQNNALRYDFTDPNYKKGIDWFNSGFSLDDASEDLRNNGSFIMGFKKGQHNKIINETFYEAGIKFSRNGIPLDMIEDKFKNNEYFMNGYNSCKGRNK